MHSISSYDLLCIAVPNVTRSQPGWCPIPNPSYICGSSIGDAKEHGQIPTPFWGRPCATFTAPSITGTPCRVASCGVRSAGARLLGCRNKIFSFQWEKGIMDIAISGGENASSTCNPPTRHSTLTANSVTRRNQCKGFVVHGRGQGCLSTLPLMPH